MTTKTKQKKYALGSIAAAKSPEPATIKVSEEDKALVQEVVETIDEQESQGLDLSQLRIDDRVNPPCPDKAVVIDDSQDAGIEFLDDVQETPPAKKKAPAAKKKAPAAKKKAPAAKKKAPAKKRVQPAKKRVQEKEEVVEMGWFAYVMSWVTWPLQALWGSLTGAAATVAESKPVATGREAGEKAAKRTLEFLAALPAYFAIACFAAATFLDVLGIALLDSAIGAVAVLSALLGGLLFSNKWLAGIATIACLVALALHVRRWLRERRATR